MVWWRGEESKESRRVSYTRGLCKQNPTESRLALRLKHRARSQAATAKNETQRLGYRLFRIPRPFSLSLFSSLFNSVPLFFPPSCWAIGPSTLSRSRFFASLLLLLLLLACSRIYESRCNFTITQNSTRRKESSQSLSYIHSREKERRGNTIECCVWRNRINPWKSVTKAYRLEILLSC